jgi:hypothetical protein
VNVAVDLKASNRWFPWGWLLALSVPWASSLTMPPAAQGSDELAIPRPVLQVLKRNCLKCHGVSKSEGQLQLHTAVRIWRGGEAGAAVVPFALEHSTLWQRVLENEMPPNEPLSEAEKQTLSDWIEQGAQGLPLNREEAERMQRDEHWAFTRLKAANPPQVIQGETCRSPVDQFLLADLERAGIAFGREAERSTLLRRVSFTLTGLPPTPEDISLYLADQRVDATERMIDRYLASPQYGVRWGRHWLDAAGYADSNGYFNADSDRPLAYQYRDYVVRSMNADKPFDQFVREQIAGDELSGFDPSQHRRAATPEMIDMLIATHYLRNGQDGSGESDGNPDEVRIDRYSALEAAQQIIASSLLGLTVQCAKCHDHKFEPLTQLDYYRMQSVLFPAYNPQHWIKPNDRTVMASLPGEFEKWEAEVKAADQRALALSLQLRAWIGENRAPESVLFSDEFTQPELLDSHWTSTIPGDDSPAGTAAITLRREELDQADALPAALVSQGQLKIIEGGTAGDKWLSTRQTFDWTPAAEGSWIQVSFDLVDNKLDANEPPAERIAFGIALHDYNNNSPLPGGNLLIDGRPTGGAAVDLDYPGPSAKRLGDLGRAQYIPDRSFGVRVTHLPDGVYRLEHVVDALPEGTHIDLREEDLPDGSFGFEFCCGRSFIVDNVVIEVSDSKPTEAGQSPDGQAFAATIAGRREEITAARAQLAALRAAEPGRIAWITDSAPAPPEVFLLARGEYSQPTEKVEPAPLSALDDSANPLRVEAPASGARSSGRRAAWAKWVTQADSRPASLMARVQANRVWQHHFGTGLVATSENLGMSGAEPSNQALLDRLAGEFIRSGWSLKSLHRLILNSTVFQQSSLANAAAFKVDPANQLYWRYPLRRLDAESIRDAQLAISGELDLPHTGPYVATRRTGTAEVIVAEDQTGAFRRSIAIQQRRTQGLSLLNVFDSPTMVVNCTRRPVTTMPLQSLTLLNSEFAVKRGEGFARRLQREVGPVAEQAIRRAFWLAVGRECTAPELADALEFLSVQEALYADEANAGLHALSDFCQLLLASNTCLYLE